jgi:hypothetical protein
MASRLLRPSDPLGTRDLLNRMSGGLNGSMQHLLTYSGHGGGADGTAREMEFDARAAQRAVAALEGRRVAE